MDNTQRGPAGLRIPAAVTVVAPQLWQSSVKRSKSQQIAPANTGQTADVDGKELAIAAMEARIASLEAQLHAKDELLSVKDTQIDQLHHLFLQTALSAASVRPWWKIW